MGTRADFWLGRGADAEWLGSIQYDGHPKGLTGSLLLADDEQEYRAAVAALLADREDALRPDSATPPKWLRLRARMIDYTYTFFYARMWASRYGSPWFDPLGADWDPEYGPDCDDDTWDGIGDSMMLDDDTGDRRAIADYIATLDPPHPPLPRGEEWRGDRWREDDWCADDGDGDHRGPDFP